MKTTKGLMEEKICILYCVSEANVAGRGKSLMLQKREHGRCEGQRVQLYCDYGLETD